MRTRNFMAVLLILGEYVARVTSARDPIHLVGGRGKEGRPMDQQTSALESTLIKIVATRVGVPFVRVQSASRLVEDLGAEDLDLFELRMELEEVFEIIISDEEAYRARTVADLSAIISTKLRALSSGAVAAAEPPLAASC